MDRSVEDTILRGGGNFYYLLLCGRSLSGGGKENRTHWRQSENLKIFVSQKVTLYRNLQYCITAWCTSLSLQISFRVGTEFSRLNLGTPASDLHCHIFQYCMCAGTEADSLVILCSCIQPQLIWPKLDLRPPPLYCLLLRCVSQQRWAICI